MGALAPEKKIVIILPRFRLCTTIYIYNNICWLVHLFICPHVKISKLIPEFPKKLSKNVMAVDTILPLHYLISCCVNTNFVRTGKDGLKKNTFEWDSVSGCFDSRPEHCPFNQ
jgi:hypothetical protein